MGSSEAARSALDDAVPADARLEVKFVAAHVHLHVLLNWLRVHPAGFRFAHPDRLVNNVYFDTPRYDSYVENLFGSSARTKVRYRWYGGSAAPGPGALEVKRRRNIFGWKLRYEVPIAPPAAGRDPRGLQASLRPMLPPEGRMWLDAHALPVLVNSYRRRYLESAHTDVRATVDTDLTTRDLRFLPEADAAGTRREAETVVVEFKVNRDKRHLASDILQGFPLRAGRHSKYVAGLRALAWL